MADLLNAVMELIASALRAIGLLRPGRRHEIKADLELLQMLQVTPGFGIDSHEAQWLRSQIALQMLHLARVPVPGTRRPLKKGSFVSALLITGGFTYWTYRLDQSGFSWWSIVTGFVAFFAFVGGVVSPITDPKLEPWPETPTPVVPPPDPAPVSPSATRGSGVSDREESK